MNTQRLTNLINGGWILAGADEIEMAGMAGYARQIRACAE